MRLKYPSGLTSGVDLCAARLLLLLQTSLDSRM